jgi:hypothetical protein
MVLQALWREAQLRADGGKAGDIDGVVVRMYGWLLLEEADEEVWQDDFARHGVMVQGYSVDMRGYQKGKGAWFYDQCWGFMQRQVELKSAVIVLLKARGNGPFMCDHCSIAAALQLLDCSSSFAEVRVLRLANSDRAISEA